MATKDAGAQPMTRRQLEEKIVARAWKDEAFRRSFLSDPKGAFEKHVGTKLPPSLKITAHAEDENHLHFVIPQKPGANLGELSDAELERVAGGVTPVAAIIAVSVVGTAAAVAAFGLAIERNNIDHGREHW